MKLPKPTLLFIIISLLMVLGGSSLTSGRALYDAEEQSSIVYKPAQNAPFVDVGVHNIGKIGMTVVNMGQFGTGFVTGSLPGEAPSCQYPYPSQKDYLFAGSFWIGAVVGRDTLVSVGADGWQLTREMYPNSGSQDWPAGGAIIERSISDPNDEDAKSEQDFIAVYSDTIPDELNIPPDPVLGRPHIPLNIEVTQRSYAWSYSYAEDFILFDYSIRNIGRRTLNKVYMGIYVDGDVKPPSGQEGFDDDICGFKFDIETEKLFPRFDGCGFRDTIRIAWIADNDGRQKPEDQSCVFPALTGTRVVRTPSDSLDYSFNWWISHGDAALDWGPRKQGIPEDPFRDFGGYLGTPEGDHNKYYIMRHQEFDYDQLFCALDHTADGWLPPPEPPSRAADFANGYDTRYLLSFGPFDINPGEILPISFSYVAGEQFHDEGNNCNTFEEIFNSQVPEEFYSTLDFGDFAENAVWASWIYDNPGVDTDDDKYFGKFRICVRDSQFGDVIDSIFDTTIVDDEIVIDTVVDTTQGWTVTVADTQWYQGDGVPDFKGASPPPAPELWVIDTTGDTLRSKCIPRVDEFNQGEIRVRWNGLKSETTKDAFSGQVDFEGYRVYVSYSPSGEDFSLVASYDVQDYNRWTYNPARGEWELLEPPFTLEELQAIYGDDFDPLDYDTPENFLNFEGTAYYFETQDWNQSDLTDMSGIHKVYPEQAPPTWTSIDSARIYTPEELTDDGLFFKYYEYEYILSNLLPSQLHYIGITAFDYGSPVSGLPSLETPPNQNFIVEYPQNHASTVVEEGLDVVVYPNPYRIDASYKQYGFEGRDYIDANGNLIQQEGLNEDRQRSIHFINLPPKCTIRIFTLDGDLVREIDHDVPADYPQSGHERWDLITRNTQAVVSGIYYYSVESDQGNQVGKIVIIM